MGFGDRVALQMRTTVQAEVTVVEIVRLQSQEFSRWRSAPLANNAGYGDLRIIVADPRGHAAEELERADMPRLERVGTGVCEGDTPADLHLISAVRGINDPDDPTQPSWGGQYKRKPGTNDYVDGPGGSSISRWREDFQTEFQERADWCVEPASKADSARSNQ